MSDRDYKRYFDALGLRPGASEAEIAKAKRAYNELYHSDRLAHMSEKARVIAAERIKDVNEAAQALLDPATRPFREAWVREHQVAYGRPCPVVEPSRVDLGKVWFGGRAAASIHIGFGGSRPRQPPRIAWEPPVEWIQVETVAGADQSNYSYTLVILVHAPSHLHSPGITQVHFTIEVDGVLGHADLQVNFAPANSGGKPPHLGTLRTLLGRATPARGAMLLALFILTVGLLATVFLRDEATERTVSLAARDLGPAGSGARTLPPRPTREVARPKAQVIVDSTMSVPADGSWTLPVAVGGTAFRVSFFTESDTLIYRVRLNGAHQFVVAPGAGGSRFEGPVRTFEVSSLTGHSFPLKFSRWRDDSPRGSVVHVSTTVAAAAGSWSPRIWPGQLGVHWESDRQVAYDVRDERGRLYHMGPGVKSIVVPLSPEWLQFRSIDSLPLVIRVIHVKP